MLKFQKALLVFVCGWRSKRNSKFLPIFDAIPHKSMGCPIDLSFQARMLAFLSFRILRHGWNFLFYSINILSLQRDKNLVSCVTFKKVTRRMILRPTAPSARPPACSPCWSLPGLAVKRAVPSGTRERCVWAALSPPLIPPPPHLPHGPDWCGPALFSRRIIGIIEWHVVLRAKPEPNGSFVWAILPLGC